MTKLSELRSRFRARYGRDARIFHAPGRVNLIGEHTDYNDGFVLPAAIDLFTWVAIAPREDRLLRLHSANLDRSAEFNLDTADREAGREWSNYIIGVAIVLDRNPDRLAGADLLVQGDVPIAAGVSSSAALEVAAGFALMANCGRRLERIDLQQLALACQRAEHEYVGTQCGIMDQLASACCVKSHALLLDCRSLESKNIPLPADIQLVVCNSMVKRELAASAYNTRRAECEEGVRILARHDPNIHALRDVSMRQLKNCEREIPPLVYKRCRHVISENERVIAAAGSLERCEMEALGRLMAESHQSLQDDYEVSCNELDLLVELANQVQGTRGARMTGAGFGGCTINLVDSEAVSEFQRHISVEYERRIGMKPDIYTCKAADGVREEE